ncbi:hypothetical protein GMMP1_1260003 [Candidatus Magnetomoraceae bacterium gMMP-1]
MELYFRSNSSNPTGPLERGILTMSLTYHDIVNYLMTLPAISELVTSVASSLD